MRCYKSESQNISHLEGSVTRLQTTAFPDENDDEDVIKYTYFREKKKLI